MKTSMRLGIERLVTLADITTAASLDDEGDDAEMVDDATMDTVHVPAAGGSATPAKRKPKRAKLEMTFTSPGGHSVSIRHMRAVELAAGSAGADGDQGGSVWIQLAKVGQFAGHPAGPFELSAKVFAEIVSNFNKLGQPIPIDYEHASEADPTSGSIPTNGAPAQGWIVGLDNRGDGGLWGLVEWGAQARAQIRSGQYRFISPAMRFGSRDRVSGKPIGTRLTSAALTNQPFLSSMQPLAASDRGDATDNDLTDPAGSGAPAEAGKEETNMNLQEQFEKLSAEHAALTSKWTETVRERDQLKVELSTEKANVTNARALGDAAVTKITGDKDVEIKTLKDQIAKRDEAELGAYVKETIATYGDKLPTKDEASLLALCKADTDGFKKVFPKIDADKKHLMRDLTGGGGKREAATGNGGAGAGEPKELPTMKALCDKHRAQLIKDGVDENSANTRAVNMAFNELSVLRAGRAA